MIFDTSPPPRGFGSGQLYTSPLRVYYHDSQAWVWDRDGFLCSFYVHTTTGKEFLFTLLEAEAAKPPDPIGRRRYWPTARDLIYPGTAEAREAKALELDRVITQAVGKRSDKPGKTTIEDLFS